jgi:hypothetical protein
LARATREENRLEVFVVPTKIKIQGTVYAALHDESDKGWVWLPGVKSVRRKTVFLWYPEKRSAVYCEVREIDPNFVKVYAREHGKTEADYTLNDMIVISQWYRDALGIERTEMRVTIEVSESRAIWKWWADIRATSQHPDPVARLATRLGVIGLVVGILGTTIPFLVDGSWSFCTKSSVMVLLALLCLLAVCGCWGIKNRALKRE